MNKLKYIILISASILILVSAIFYIDGVCGTHCQSNTLKIKIEPLQVYADCKNEVVEPVEPVELKQTSLGTFRVTSYCPCAECNGEWVGCAGASGSTLIPNYSVAVDPNVIPYGTEIIIDGRKYRADDCGGAIKGNRIDIYSNSHDDAMNYGVKDVEIYMEVE